MSEYSKIRYIHLENFMGYQDQTVDFAGNNILHLTGDNGSGKSSVIRALEVAFSERHSRLRNNLIRKGADLARITVAFEDGIHVEYLRQPSTSNKGKKAVYKGTESYTIYHYLRENSETYTLDDYTVPMPISGGKRIIDFTTADGDTLTPVQGVPPQIEAVMGFTYVSLNDKDVPLNIGTRNDPTFLVETSGRDNYASMSIIGNTAYIFEAQENINDKILELKRTEKAQSSNLQLLYNQVASGSNLQTGAVKGIDEAIKALEEAEDNYHQVSKLAHVLQTIVETKVVKTEDISIPDMLPVQLVIKFEHALSVLLDTQNNYNTVSDQANKAHQDMAQLQEEMQAIGLTTITCWNCGATNGVHSHNG